MENTGNLFRSCWVDVARSPSTFMMKAKASIRCTRGLMVRCTYALVLAKTHHSDGQLVSYSLRQ